MSYPKIVVTPPGPKAKKIIARDERYISPSFGRAYPLVVKEAKGCIVTDVDGNEFIDMNAGLAVTNVGHSHPKVLKAIHEQVDKFLSYSYTDFFYENYIDLGEQLHEIVPGRIKRSSSTVTAALRRTRRRSSSPAGTASASISSRT